MNKQSKSFKKINRARGSQLKVSSVFLGLSLSLYAAVSQAGERDEALALLARLLKEEQERQAQLAEQDQVKAEENVEAKIDEEIELSDSQEVDANFITELVEELDAESESILKSEYASLSGGQVYFVDDSSDKKKSIGKELGDYTKKEVKSTAKDTITNVKQKVADGAGDSISNNLLKVAGLASAATVGVVALSGDDGGGGDGGSIVEARSQIGQLDDLLEDGLMLDSNYNLSNDAEKILLEMFEFANDGVFVQEDLPVEFVAWLVEKMIFNGFHQEELINDKHGDALLRFVVENTAPNGVDQVYQAKAANLMVQAYEVFSKVDHNFKTITMADLENYYVVYYDQNSLEEDEDSETNYVVELINLDKVEEDGSGEIEFQGKKYQAEFYEQSRTDQDDEVDKKLQLIESDQNSTVNSILQSGMMAEEVYYAINDWFREYQNTYDNKLDDLGQDNLLGFIKCELMPSGSCANEETRLDIAKAGWEDYVALAFDDFNTQMLMEFFDVYDMQNLNQGAIKDLLLNVGEWLDLSLYGGTGSELYTSEQELKQEQQQLSYAFTNALYNDVVVNGESTLTANEVQSKLNAWNDVFALYKIKTLEQIQAEAQAENVDIQSCLDSNEDDLGLSYEKYADECIVW